MPSSNDFAPYATAVPVYPLQPESKEQRKTPPTSSYKSASLQVNESHVEQLMQQGFTRGLAQSMAKNNQHFPYRIWVVDNSGSMQRPDGHRIVETLNSNTVKIVPGTRWEEIRECVNYHIRASNLLQVPTTFRLLNNPGSRVGPQNFTVAGSTNDNTATSVTEYEAIKIVLDASPGGGTPLTAHIQDIYTQVQAMAADLRQSGSRVVICIATDGLPTDESAVGGVYQQQRFVDALRTLEGLPVWVVIRLCTDDDDVVDFYNNLDEQLELSLEVLDDFCGEAMEVYEHNKWLNYGLPLHRCREMGFYDRVFDLIDERTLAKSELRDFCKLLFGDGAVDGIPDPSVDWLGFCSDIERLLRQEKLAWNPVTKKTAPWIDMRALNHVYGGGNGCACIIL